MAAFPLECPGDVRQAYLDFEEHTLTTLDSSAGSAATWPVMMLMANRAT
jgi:hypothetical protein